MAVDSKTSFAKILNGATIICTITLSRGWAFRTHPAGSDRKGERRIRIGYDITCANDKHLTAQASFQQAAAEAKSPCSVTGRGDLGR